MIKEESVSLEYLAGFFDGEGCITVLKQGRELACGIEGTQPQIRVGTKRKEECQLFKEKFGGNIFRDEKSDMWYWTIQSKESIIEFVEKMDTLLRGKQESLALMKRFLKTYKDNMKFAESVPKDTAKQRLKIAEKINNKEED